MTSQGHKSQGCCSLLFLKYILFIFNFLFWISGIVLLVFGIWLTRERHHYISLLDSNTFPVATYLLIACGSIILFVGIIGCIGAVRDLRFFLLIYAFFLLLIFLLEAIAGVLAYMYEGTIHEELRRTLNKTMLNNYKFNMEKTNAIDSMQKNFKCCGAGSFKDWQHSRWLHDDKQTKNKTPDSCCKSPSERCAVRDHPSNIYYIGCADKLEAFFKDNLVILGSIGLGLCFLQVFGIIFACCLMKRIKEKTTKHYL